jgi:glutathione S-transferase
MIELYHCHNARSFRALWALEEIGLTYRLHMLPFPPRIYQPEYLDQNPLGTIPLLVDGKVRMTESAAIPHYLATRYGPTPLVVEVEEYDYGLWLDWLHRSEADRVPARGVAFWGHRDFRHQFEPIMLRAQPIA